MERIVDLMDAARRLLPVAGLSGNLASPRERPGWPSPRTTAGLAMLREGAMASPKSCITAWPDHGRVQGLALARVRSGPLAWEVAALHLDAPDGASAAEVLDVVARAVGQKGGVRLFLRLPADSSLTGPARHAGFFPAYQESIFLRRAAPPEATSRPENDGAAPPARVRSRSDEAGLFHLYCAAVPAPVRGLIGMSRDEWVHGQPRGGRSARELVWEHDGKLCGHLRQTPRRNAMEGEFLLHPDHVALAEPVLDTALRQYPGTWQWLVPEYQPLVPGILAAQGFQELGQYITLVRALAATVPVPKAAPAVEA